MDDGPVLQVLDELLGLVQVRPLLCFGRRTLHQLNEVMAVNKVHVAEPASSVVPYLLQVLPFAGE